MGRGMLEKEVASLEALNLYPPDCISSYAHKTYLL